MTGFISLTLDVYSLIRFHLESAKWLSVSEKLKISEHFKSSLSNDGWIIVKSDKTRSQFMNQADAIYKLRTNIEAALEPPKPKFTEEELSKMKKGKVKANKERLQNKRYRGDTKKERGAM